MPTSNVPVPSVEISNILAVNDVQMSFEEKEHFFRLFLQHDPVGVAMFDHEMRYIAVNGRFAEDCGKQESELIGQSHYEVFPDLLERWREYHRRGLAGETIRMEDDIDVSLNGRMARIRWEIMPWHTKNGVGGIILFTEILAEQKEDERAHRQTKERYARVIEGSDQSFWDWNLMTREFEVSPRFEYMLGYGKGELLEYAREDMGLSLPETWSELVHPDDLAKALESIDRHLKGLTPTHEVEVRVRTRSGAWKWLFTKGRIVERDKEGNPFIMSGTFTDIDERKKREERERRMTKIYRALGATNDAILKVKSARELFPHVCQIAVGFGGMAHARVGVPDAEGKFVTVARFGKLTDFERQIVTRSTSDTPEGNGPSGIAFRVNRPVIVNDALHDDLVVPWCHLFQAEGVNAITAFPIERGGTPYAVFTLYSDQAGAFDPEIVRLLQDIVKNMGFALDSFDREADRRKAQDALQLTQHSLDIAVDPVFWVRSNGSFQFFNEAAHRYLGYSREEMQTMAVLDIDPHITAEIWHRIWEEEKQYQSRKFETEHLTKDGSLIPVEVTVNRVEYGGQEYRFAFIRDISERKRSEELIWQQANFDSLTGLPNRRLFHEQLEKEILKAQRTALPLAIVFIDLDNFKDVNDTMGHAAGDNLLKQVAERIVGCVRDIDTVARFSGDEFIIILADLNNNSGAERVARNVLDQISGPFVLENEVAYTSASIGITFYPNDAPDAANLLKNADQAMYDAKRQGGNRYSYYDANMQAAALRRHHLIKHMHSALEAQQFQVVYQPIVELATGSVHKAEALLRWHHPERGFISPTEFIPLAEQSGLIAEIGDWVFRQAVQKVTELRERYHPDFQISVNKSPAQFRNIKSFYRTWLDYLDQQVLPGDCIVIEITESLLMDDVGMVADKLNAFRSGGMQISLDDFGTGYSSLSYLQKFELDFLKIDQVFVRNLAPNSSDMALCEAIIVMAHKLGIKVIAEGVETQEQRDLLAAIGCDYAQGYLFSKPVSASELDRWLLEAVPYLQDIP